MAKYTLGVPSCLAIKTRSLRNDTLSATMALRVMNAQGGLHQDYGTLPAMKLGDYGQDAVVNTNLFYLDIDVPDPTPTAPDGGAVYWSFMLVNAGQTNVTELTTALNNAAAGVVGAFVSSGNILAEVAAGGLVALQALMQLLTAGCDGPVAALALNYTAAQLAQMTSNPASWTYKMNFPGVDSPHGCGPNSNYDVHYIIANRSQVTVPSLINKSPAVAQTLVQQAGLVYSSVIEKTGGPKQVPTIESQVPAANTLAKPGSGVEAIIIEASPKGHPTP